MEPLPVRRRLTILRDGSTHASDLVFCDSRGHSVPLALCAACKFGGDVERDASGRGVTVECCRFTLPSFRGTGVSEVAAVVPVGVSLVRPVVCIAYDAPLRAAARALTPESLAWGIAVVDEQQRFLGMVPRGRLPLALGKWSDDAAAAYMTVDRGSVDESASLGEAFGTMAASHARELPVLGEGRRFAGVVRDVEALRFVAHVSRTGLRPEIRILCA